MRLPYLLLLSLLLAPVPAAAADWPRFRGPNGSGVVEADSPAELPTEFGPGRNVAWKQTVPFGRSSPIVAGGRVFLTATDGGAMVTLAYDAASGRLLWRREVPPARELTIYKANDAASPTPVSDGENVYVFFSNFGLVSYTHAGRERWRRPLGPFENFYGIGSSPIVAGGMVILLCDQAHGSFLAAYDSATGRERWKTERREHPEGWSVPVVFGDQLIAAGTTRIDSYHLATGEPRWWLPLSSNGSMGSPVVSTTPDGRAQLIVTASGSEQPWMPSFAATAAKLDKNGDGRLSIPESQGEKEWFEHFAWVDSNHDQQLDEKEWETARAFGVGDYGAVAIPLEGNLRGRLDPGQAIRWRFKRNLPYVPAPVLFDGVFYMVKDGGVITSLEPSSGALLKQGRAEKALGAYFASPVAGGGKVFLLNEEGKLTVMKAGRQWEVLAVNDLGDECYATPAISGGRLFVRTRSMLYSFAEGAKPR